MIARMREMSRFSSLEAQLHPPMGRENLPPLSSYEHMEGMF